MNKTLKHQLTFYRSLGVAITNAAITWIVLIVAPLGLFAVILCTALVFVGSLAAGVAGDRIVSSLIKNSSRDTNKRIDVQISDEFDVQPEWTDSSLLKSKQSRNLP